MAWEKWRDEWSEIRKQRRLLQYGVWKLAHQGMFRALNSWRSWVRTKRELSHKMLDAIHDMLSSKLLVAMRRWRRVCSVVRFGRVQFAEKWHDFRKEVADTLYEARGAVDTIEILVTDDVEFNLTKTRQTVHYIEDLQDWAT